MWIADMAALMAALTWAVSGLIAVGPARALGAIAFSRIRMPIVFVMLALVATVFGGWQTIRVEDLPILSVSGFIGIFMGDTALFASLRRVGPRRNSILFATHAPISAVLGYLFFSEILNFPTFIGCAIVLLGVVLSIIFGKRREKIHQWEDVHGPLWLGVSFGLTAGFCQAVGAVLAKPALLGGADPIAVSAVRVGVSSLFLLATLLIPGRRFAANTAMTPSLFAGVVVSGFLGMGVGMSLLLYALAYESTGIVMTLSATTPVMILPLLWWKTRQRPATGALAAALLTVAGCALIFNY